ncbi:MAG TPA: acyclic terpene utilization AtuA family protein, partial [Burkholderiales bacterium]|nr:acyclic terpene utilization AtuA family protein [Burkholderiales bacterium]
MPAAENEIRILSPTGVCGSGFIESSFEKALSQKPDFIGCDAGSTDPGPSYLGSGNTAFPKDAIRRDLKLMLLGARRLGIPLLLGSAGTAGADVQLDFFYALVKEIAATEKLKFKLALIHSEQKKPYLTQKLREGRIKPLDPAPEFNQATIDRSEHIVGMMGAEPFMRALEAGAEVIVAGRASDTAIFAAMPVMRGFPEGLAWHAAKILECG